MTIINGVAYIDPEKADAAYAANSALLAPVKAGPDKGCEVRNDDPACEVTTLTKGASRKVEGYKAREMVEGNR